MVMRNDMRRILITGSEDITDPVKERTKEFVRKAVDNQLAVVTGGGRGVDHVVIDEMRSLGKAEELIIYLPQQIQNQPQEVRLSLYEAEAEGALLWRDMGMHTQLPNGQYAQTYEQAEIMRDVHMIKDSDAVTAVVCNRDVRSEAMLKTAEHVEKPVARIGFKEGSFTIEVFALKLGNLLSIPASILGLVLDKIEFDESVKRAKELMEKVQNGTATPEEVQELEHLTNTHWSAKVDGGGGTGRGGGNSYHDALGRFCSTENAVRICA
jgi:hypothetical protein